MDQAPIFHAYEFGTQDKQTLDRDGHFVLAGLLLPATCERLTQSLSTIEALIEAGVKDPLPNHNAAEYDSYLESLLAHPQLLTLVRQALGDNIRFDHCVTLNRPSGNGGVRWHSHEYAEDDPSLGFLRIFFYVNGFELDNGNLKAVPGSHVYRDAQISGETDAAFQSGWLAGKTHAVTGAPLQIEPLAVPPATVILMWTHAAHAVNPRLPDSPTRWAVVYAYRNPGRPSRARWISEAYEKKLISGAKGLMSLY